MGHHKAASCSTIPSFQSFTSISTSSTQFDQQQQEQSNLKRSIAIPSISNSQHSIDQQEQLFPLPSFCLYSKIALTNEYAPESDIIQFLSPASTILEERLPMFVGVLQSLLTVVNDMPFINDNDDDDSEDENDGEEVGEVEVEEDNSSSSSNSQLGDEKEIPFTIIGLNAMKLVIWNNMYDNIVDMSIYEKDLCLVVMVSLQVSDNTILENMDLLRESVASSTSSSAITVTANQMGDQLIPLIEYWFNLQED